MLTWILLKLTLTQDSKPSGGDCTSMGLETQGHSCHCHCHSLPAQVAWNARPKTTWAAHPTRKRTEQGYNIALFLALSQHIPPQNITDTPGTSQSIQVNPVSCRHYMERRCRRVATNSLAPLIASGPAFLSVNHPYGSVSTVWPQV